MSLPQKGCKRVTVIIFYAILAVILAYFFFKYILGCILPFAVAFIAAHSTRHIVLCMGSKLNFKRSFSVFVVTTLLLGAVFGIFYLLFSKIFSELSVLADFLTEDNITAFITDTADRFTSLIGSYFPGIIERLTPVISGVAKDLDAVVSSAVQTALPAIGKAVMSFFKALPSVFLFAGVTLLAMFYFGCDYEKIIGFIKKQLTEKQILFVKELKNQFFITVLNILRAYTILILLTFAQLWVGFIIAGIDYATLLAAFIAIIDVLPVIGTGTVLVPWSVILFITGNVKTGLCILLLYVIITVIRQVAEPKILGSSVGLHPLVTLASMYSGIKLMGVKGLFLLPLTVIIIKNLNEKGFIRLYKNPDTTGKKET